MRLIDADKLEKHLEYCIRETENTIIYEIITE